jgi:hypothetical protein
MARVVDPVIQRCSPAADDVVAGRRGRDVVGRLPPPAHDDGEDRGQHEAAEGFSCGPPLSMVLPGGGTSGSGSAHWSWVVDQDGHDECAEILPSDSRRVGHDNRWEASITGAQASGRTGVT